jgi:hypothetical protein
MTDLGAYAEYIFEDLPDQTCVHVGMIETLREAMADRIFEAFMTENGCIDEPTKRTLGRHDLLRFGADGLPDRIVSLDPAAWSGL